MAFHFHFSVLDLDAFERINKAEGLGMSSDACSGEKNLEDAATTCKLFRFLQLLCEGHNLGMSGVVQIKYKGGSDWSFLSVVKRCWSTSSSLCVLVINFLYSLIQPREVIKICCLFLTEFQNYLRTQAGNNTTVNIVICTVDYLLRLQESMMDFYWHYSGKEIIDPSGKGNFCRAINVAKQVFRTLTEYIQVCIGSGLCKRSI